MSSRKRADLLLVERHFFASRAQAQAAIAAGLVIADGVRVTRASDRILAEAEIVAEAEHPWVSRGGVKLAAALEHFGFDPHGAIALDIGASTGGFTQVLLARGAAHVYAVDVGRDQLHATLRNDPHVTSLEQVDIRHLEAARLSSPPSVVTIDVSFISLKHVLPAATALAAPSARLVALIKPQFEAGRNALKKGIVRDPAVQTAVRDDVVHFAETLGWVVAGVIPSPITGGDGNVEFLLGARRD
jgi:23S rRNA (cytidine1920-2'-O)/16S rRNA (cytidine1409-2'-O)-methyltransferase